MPKKVNKKEFFSKFINPTKEKIHKFQTKLLTDEETDIIMKVFNHFCDPSTNNIRFNDAK